MQIARKMAKICNLDTSNGCPFFGEIMRKKPCPYTVCNTHCNNVNESDWEQVFNNNPDIQDYCSDLIKFIEEYETIKNDQEYSKIEHEVLRFK